MNDQTTATHDDATAANDDLTIVREIVIDAPASAVFAALSEPEQLVQWWGDDSSYRCAKMEADLRVNGAWRTTGADGDGNPFAVFGTYRVVEPPTALEFTWRHDRPGTEPASETVVRYDLSQRGTSTLLRVTHSGFTDRADFDDHNNGWVTVLRWVRGYLTPAAASTPA